MADNTHIEWADATWQPITGCSVVSPGCTNCYAMRLAGTRLQHHWSRQGLTAARKAGPVWTGEVRFNADWLDQPLRWKRPRRIFVCAHGDLFHEAAPDDWIDKVFAVMALAPQHVFLVLTKRAQRMRAYLSDAARCGMEWCRWAGVVLGNRDPGAAPDWPLSNVWLGVSAEDQARADERIPDLLAAPAAKRFLSAEPLLGPIDLASIRRLDGDKNALTGELWIPGVGSVSSRTVPGPRLDWVIVGGESGPGARPMHPDWARALRDQCQAAGVPYFFKQWGEHLPNFEIADLWVADGEIRRTDQGLWVAGRGKANAIAMSRVGKRAAGRLLDGREWSEMPA